VIPTQQPRSSTSSPQCAVSIPDATAGRFNVPTCKRSMVFALTPNRSHPYKCPLPQPLSFDILTNARGVYPHASHSGNCSQFATPEPLFQRFLFKSLHTLPSSVSRKSFACHSYENCRVYTNNSHSGTRPSGLRFLCALSVSALHSSSCSAQPSNLQTFQPSNVLRLPPVDNRRGASHNSSSAPSPLVASITEEGE
jgi:hypothetical protein